MSTDPEHRGRWAVHADRIFDGERVRTGEAVLVAGDTIVDVTPIAEVPPHTPITPFPGCTLLPGLIDLHAHFMRWEGPHFLAHGVTTIRDVGNRLDWILDRRAEWGANPWPRICTFGPILDGPTPLHGDCARACRDADEARQAVAETADAGVDGIKLYVGLQPEWLPGMVDEAHSRSLHVAMHCGTASALVAGAAGIDEFFHLDGLLADIWPDNPGGWLSAFGLPGFGERLDQQNHVADRIKELGMIATPTLAWWDTNWRALSPGYPTAEDVEDIPEDIATWLCANCEPNLEAADTWRRALATAQQFVALLLEREVVVLPGTDVFCGLLRPGQSLWKELALLVECGMSPIDALRAATSAAAACLNDDRLGRIAPGAAADLVVVRGDPTRGTPVRPEMTLVVRAGKTFAPNDLLVSARRDARNAAGDPWQAAFRRGMASA